MKRDEISFAIQVYFYITPVPRGWPRHLYLKSAGRESHSLLPVQLFHVDRVGDVLNRNNLIRHMPGVLMIRNYLSTEK